MGPPVADTDGVDFWQPPTADPERLVRTVQVGGVLVRGPDQRRGRLAQRLRARPGLRAHGDGQFRRENVRDGGGARRSRRLHRRHVQGADHGHQGEVRRQVRLVHRRGPGMVIRFRDDRSPG